MAQSILIVDDERDIVSMLNQYFCKIGYVVYTAINGKEALNAITKHPDIILLDINMPDMNGFTICEKIRNFVSCPIIFLTARIEDCDKIKGFPKEFVTGTVKRIARFISSYEQVNNNICCLAVKKNRCQQ